MTALIASSFAAGRKFGDIMRAYAARMNKEYSNKFDLASNAFSALKGEIKEYGSWEEVVANYYDVVVLPVEEAIIVSALAPNDPILWAARDGIHDWAKGQRLRVKSGTGKVLARFFDAGEPVVVSDGVSLWNVSGYIVEEHESDSGRTLQSFLVSVDTESAVSALTTAGGPDVG